MKIAKKINKEQEKFDLAASFQKTIEEILYEKSKIAFKEYKNINKKNNNIFVVAGGVAANKQIRKKLTNLSIQENFKPIFPPINLCSDNAAMIAWAGIERYKLKLINNLEFPSKARWPLDDSAPFLKGPGLKL